MQISDLSGRVQNNGHKDALPSSGEQYMNKVRISTEIENARKYQVETVELKNITELT